MARGSAALDEAAAPYVGVRITDLSRWDLALARFDFDLTFAALLMHPDGTVYHRYGGRGPDDPAGYLSLPTLARLLDDTVGEHRAYLASGDRRPAAPPQLAQDLPVLAQKRQAGQRMDCVHCHSVHDAEHREAVQRGTFQPEQRWLFPDPARLGLTLDTTHQAQITAVAADSPAARLGLAQGDTLLALGEQRSVRTFTDVQWALQQAPAGATRLPVRWRSGKAERHGELVLAAGWKHCDPRDYAWRPYKWNLSPQTGFGGPWLPADRRRALGLPADTFALTVQYFVDWGEQRHRGAAAKASGLQKGDVVVGFAGRSDYASIEHWHADVALSLRPGQEVALVVLRDGRRETLRYRLPG